MKLHALHRVGAMAQPHKQSVCRFRDDLQFVRESGALDDEAVIAIGFKGSGQIMQYALALMIDQRRFAVHWFRCAGDMTAVNLADSLMPQAHSQRGNARPAGFDDRSEE